jgi:hypothetical protein
MGKPVPSTHREMSPCNGCTERFRACSDRCPIDERGGYGYLAWKAKVKEIEDKRKSYYDDRRWKRWIVKSG